MTNLTPTWDEFVKTQSGDLFGKFPGRYRAEVVETNDPLNMRRLRFRVPEMHDSDLLPEDCPWAVPAFELGSKRHGTFSHACIGDHVWISFEKDHPYGPVWHGFATPTRRKYYGMEQIYVKSPIALKADGSIDDSPDDYDDKYLPLDGRPMSQGRTDRYGNMDISSYVGFYPSEHKDQPGKPGVDALVSGDYKIANGKPKANTPDVKYQARVTKYGHISVSGDQGYDWEKEFTGDVTKDEDFEKTRWKMIQRILCEDAPADRDQRRMENRTRYGHLIEQRDTGWNVSRAGEFGEESVPLTKDTERDLRWIKIRTKGGWLWQAYDKGFDPVEDEFVKRLLVEEHGESMEDEHELFKDKDGRFMRMIGRHGFKIVIDERGTHPQAAHRMETPRGNGILLKGRRSPGKDKTGDERGFHIEFNENEDSNQLSISTPLGYALQLSDKYEYAMLCGRLENYTPKWQGLKENEFLRDSMASLKAMESTNHLLLDQQNAMIRLKSSIYRGSKAFEPKNEPDKQLRYQQGLEIHDGTRGEGPWVELIDGEDRGLYLHKKQGIALVKSKKGSKLAICLDDKNTNIIISNLEDGKIQIQCANRIELLSDVDVTIQGKNVRIKATDTFTVEAGESSMQLSNSLVVSGDVKAAAMYARFPQCEPGNGAGAAAGQSNTVTALTRLDLPTMSPSDRGKIYNEPKPGTTAEIEHPIEGDEGGGFGVGPNGEGILGGGGDGGGDEGGGFGVGPNGEGILRAGRSPTNDNRPIA